MKEQFPEILTPNFTGNVNTRSSKLSKIITGRNGWILIGSSYGGLISTIFTSKQPELVKKTYPLCTSFNI